MSENLTDTSDHGADEATPEDTHGRHRGLTAPDDSPEADPHGRHRLDAAAN
ncbi:hypothetical protein [Kitasatospora azatica]|uniref:hypothetical protein n=1 Tax=Kitasatospora azatica TaxID=58347 RepID=UPI000B211D6F|nr:hypothetical protein [Kitasatospora azatica]